MNRQARRKEYRVYHCEECSAWHISSLKADDDEVAKKIRRTKRRDQHDQGDADPCP